MHTMMQMDETNWMVGRVERTEGVGDLFVPLFAGLGVMTAIELTSALNGGDASAVFKLSPQVFDTCAKRANELRKG